MLITLIKKIECQWKQWNVGFFALKCRSLPLGQICLSCMLCKTNNAQEKFLFLSYFIL